MLDGIPAGKESLSLLIDNGSGSWGLEDLASVTSEPLRNRKFFIVISSAEQFDCSSVRCEKEDFE